MRRLVSRVVSVCMVLTAVGVRAQTGAAAAKKISQEEVAKVLRQVMPGAAQETGGGLFDGDHYRIGALKRRLPGEVEVHREDTDVMYVLSGGATVVTGGTVVGQHAISAKEERGTAIRGGVPQVLKAGDMLVIPKGQPHWFQSVSGQVSYVVIKVQ